MDGSLRAVLFPIPATERDGFCRGWPEIEHQGGASYKYTRPSSPGAGMVQAKGAVCLSEAAFQPQGSVEKIPCGRKGLCQLPSWEREGEGKTIGGNGCFCAMDAQNPPTLDWFSEVEWFFKKRYYLWLWFLLVAGTKEQKGSILKACLEKNKTSSVHHTLYKRASKNCALRQLKHCAPNKLQSGLQIKLCILEQIGSTYTYKSLWLLRFQQALHCPSSQLWQLA